MYKNPDHAKNVIRDYRFKIRTDIDFLLSKSDEFWHHVIKMGPNDCWIWKNGSKVIHSNSGPIGCWNDITAPRVAVMIDTRTILPSDAQVKHICPENSLCVNPVHLRITHNWVKNGLCIGCGKHYQTKASDACHESQHRLRNQ